VTWQRVDQFCRSVTCQNNFQLALSGGEVGPWKSKHRKMRLCGKPSERKLQKLRMFCFNKNTERKGCHWQQYKKRIVVEPETAPSRRDHVTQQPLTIGRFAEVSTRVIVVTVSSPIRALAFAVTFLAEARNTLFRLNTKIPHFCSITENRKTTDRNTHSLCTQMNIDNSIVSVK